MKDSHATSVGISLNNVSTQFDAEESVELRNFSLDISGGEFMMIVGPTGSGKSIVLRAIAGLEPLLTGTVLFDRQTLNEFSPKYENMALVFQAHSLYQHLTVRGNIEFGLKLAHYSKADIDSRVMEAVDLLGINNLLNLKPRQLSKGQKQLVALCKAFARKPMIFLMDEPLSFLDSQHKLQVQTILRRYCNSLQATVIYTTHNPTEAMTLGDRIVCMKNGEIQQVGTSKELYSNPCNETVAKFIGYPEMNFINVKANTKERDYIFDLPQASCSIPAPEKFLNLLTHHSEFTLGIRAENLRIVPQQTKKSLPMIVEMQEFSGSDSIIYASKDFLSLSIRVPPLERYESGSEIFVEFVESELHFFVEGVCVL